jgi:hypothetical protein
MERLDLSEYLVLPADGNPNYKYELYDLNTGLFVCYYKHRRLEGKPLPKKKKDKFIVNLLPI